MSESSARRQTGTPPRCVTKQPLDQRCVREFRSPDVTWPAVGVLTESRYLKMPKIQIMTSNPDSVAKFWADVRHSLPELPPEAPEAWAFGATTKHADELLTLVLDGTKTATASSLWDYEETQEPLPEANSLSIILDGTGTPQAVIRTTEMMIVPFDQVSEEHAFCEGEGNRSLGQAGVATTG